MLAYQIIDKKKKKKKLTKEEIDFFISNYTKGEIPNYQMSALLMGIYLNGMDTKEITYLTSAMIGSGEILDLSHIPGIKVDKHSTGGVGDKVSLILAPLVASCGVLVPMLSGRGLGHTGGTLDKLESIPGFKTNLSLEEFVDNLREIGVCIMGQTEKIAPADKKIYALRDVTATVDCIPLIASSIMSKKLAGGADALVLDVKFGNGAFMESEKEALVLVKTLIQIGKKMKKKTVALITDMNEPLGEAIGNSLEVIESIQALKGNGPKDLMEITKTLGSYMLILGKKAKNFEEGINKVEDAIPNGKALEKFKEMIKRQGGNPDVVSNYDLLPKAKYELFVNSDQDGFVKSIDTKSIGLAAVELGAGRKTIDDQIDPAVGFQVKKKAGERVEKNEILATVFANDLKKGKIAKERIKEAYTINRKKTKKLKKILLECQALA